jgi:hypothetical protein
MMQYLARHAYWMLGGVVLGFIYLAHELGCVTSLEDRKVWRMLLRVSCSGRLPLVVCQCVGGQHVHLLWPPNESCV